MSSIDQANIAIRSLIAKNSKDLLEEIKEQVWDGFIARVCKEPSFAFGFDGFISSQSDSALAGHIRCAIDVKTSPRFFACAITKPWCTPKPFEYKKGDLFDIRFVDYWLLEEITGENVADAMKSTTAALARFVIKNL